MNCTILIQAGPWSQCDCQQAVMQQLPGNLLHESPFADARMEEEESPSDCVCAVAAADAAAAAVAAATFPSAAALVALTIALVPTSGSDLA